MKQGSLLKKEQLSGFLRQQGDDLYRYACSLTGELEDAADIVQTALLRFVRQVELGRIEQATAAHYLKRSIRNGAIDRARRMQREAEAPLPEDLPADLRQWLKDRQSRAIYGVLAQAASDPDLAADVRTLIRLRFLEDQPLGVLTQELARSRSAVYRLMEKAIELLERRFRAADITLEDFD